MKKNNKRKQVKGFTLVELLAVIVILAIILVIAVPKIMNTIKDATKASLESSAKMVASQVENQYTVAQTLGKEFLDTGSCMEEWAGLNENDYESCTYEITSSGEAKVTVVGKGKFKGLSVCNATRSSAEASDEECSEPATNEACFEFDSDTGTILHYYLHENNDETQAECPLDVTIPKKINGVTVTKISGNAFTDCESNACDSYSHGLDINSVNMPNTITEIGGFAFYNNQISGKLDLSKLTNLTTIDDSAFAYNNLSSINLPMSIAEIDFYAFNGNQISGELDLSMYTNLTRIGSSAFDDNQITSVKLPISINTIEYRAFGIVASLNSNPNLTTIINPSGNSFDWHNVTRQGTSSTCTFVTGTCGNVTIKAS